MSLAAADIRNSGNSAPASSNALSLLFFHTISTLFMKHLLDTTTCGGESQRVVSPLSYAIA